MIIFRKVSNSKETKTDWYDAALGVKYKNTIVIAEPVVLNDVKDRSSLFPFKIERVEEIYNKDGRGILSDVQTISRESALVYLTIDEYDDLAFDPYVWWESNIKGVK